MKKLAIVLLAGLVLVVALVAFLLIHEFDSPQLGQTLLAEVGAATGIEIKAKAFRLSLLRGLVLEGVEASSENEARRLHLALDRLVFEHRLLPLLSGTIAIDKVLLEHPQIEVVEAAEAEVRARSASGTPPRDRAQPTSRESTATASQVSTDEDQRLTLELRELVIQAGQISFTRAGETRGARLEGLTLNMNDVVVDPVARSLASLSGNGSMTLTRGTLDTLSIRDGHARFRLTDARFEMPELSFVSDYGPVAGEAQVDFNPSPFAYRMTARGAAIDLNKLLASPGGLGAASLELTADGTGAATRNIKAQGLVKLGPGTIPAIPALRGIDKALGKTVLVDWPYTISDVRFRLEGDVLTLEPFRFESEHARAALSGTASLSGPLDLDVSLATPVDGIRIEGVGAQALALLSDASGWALIPLQISGTLEQPRIRPDGNALMAQAKQGAAREAKGAAADAIRRALPRKP